jgi:hypothetical protein
MKFIQLFLLQKFSPSVFVDLPSQRGFRMYFSTFTTDTLAMIFADIPIFVILVRGFNAPMLQSFLNYALLALVFGSIAIAEYAPTIRHNWSHVRRDEVTKFVLGKGAKLASTFAFFALCDVEANFLIVLAYQYTSMLSITVLDCFTIPTVTILSIFFLGAHPWMYTRMHAFTALFPSVLDTNPSDKTNLEGAVDFCFPA